MITKHHITTTSENYIVTIQVQVSSQKSKGLGVTNLAQIFTVDLNNQDKLI